MHCPLGTFFLVSWKIWTLKLKMKFFPNLTSYFLCILKTGIWLPSKWHYFHSLLISNVCYWIYILSFRVLNCFLINFSITYSLKLVSVWVNILRVLQTRLLKPLLDAIKNILGSLLFLVPCHFLLGIFVFLFIINLYLIK